MRDPLGQTEHGYTCREVVELATEYVEGELTADQATAFEVHLNFCEGCTTFLDQIRETAASARRLSEEQVPEELRAKLIDAFRDWSRE